MYARAAQSYNCVCLRKVSESANAMLMLTLFSFGASEYENQVLHCFGLKYSIVEELIIKYCRVENSKNSIYLTEREINPLKTACGGN